MNEGPSQIHIQDISFNKALQQKKEFLAIFTSLPDILKDEMLLQFDDQVAFFRMEREIELEDLPQIFEVSVRIIHKYFHYVQLPERYPPQEPLLIIAKEIAGYKKLLPGTSVELILAALDGNYTRLDPLEDLILKKSLFALALANGHPLPPTCPPELRKLAARQATIFLARNGEAENFEHVLASTQEIKDLALEGAAMGGHMSLITALMANNISMNGIMNAIKAAITYEQLASVEYFLFHVNLTLLPLKELFFLAEKQRNPAIIAALAKAVKPPAFLPGLEIQQAALPQPTGEPVGKECKARDAKNSNQRNRSY